MENSIFFIPPVLGIAGLVLAALIFQRIMRLPGGEGVTADIAAEIHKGAMVFMKREFRLLLPFALVIGGLVFVFLDANESIAFFLGALCSSLAGYIGMFSATKANVRTTMAAHAEGSAKALSTAFFGGSIMGLTVASMGLLGVGGLFLFFGSQEEVKIIHGFAMGASLVAIFFRVGGGIFTKAADVGADLVGKVEAGIPEDDPRNPGVIADNVGDNVGDVAGMGSDLFESYCNSMIASMAIAATLPALVLEDLAAGARLQLMFLPLALASTGIVCAMLGILVVKLSSSHAPARALRMGTFGAALFFIFFAFGVVRLLGIDVVVWNCVLAGCIGGVVIGLSTEFFTGGKPMRAIAQAARTGVATVIISGIGVGLLSVVIPLLVVAAAIFLANFWAGLFGVGIAAVGMLATIGITMSIDAYGPVADNAGGIA
ncbi:MAG: sodium/proton-translocating pyrophosphatase, partial [Opitutales bacterium]